MSLRERGVAGGDRRGQRHRPDLLFGQAGRARGRQHAAEVQLEIARVVGQRITNGVQVVSRASGRLQGVFALLPVAGAQLVGLQRVEHAQHFLRAAADVQVGDVHEADHALRVHDVRGALRDAGFRVEDAERGRSARA